MAAPRVDPGTRWRRADGQCRVFRVQTVPPRDGHRTPATRRSAGLGGVTAPDPAVDPPTTPHATGRDTRGCRDFRGAGRPALQRACLPIHGPRAPTHLWAPLGRLVAENRIIIFPTKFRKWGVTPLRADRACHEILKIFLKFFSDSTDSLPRLSPRIEAPKSRFDRVLPPCRASMPSL